MRSSPPSHLGPEEAWRFLLANRSASVPSDEHRSLEVCARSQRGWRSRLEPTADGKELLDLYAPLCNRPSYVVAHLGQSIDGCVAGGDGLSRELSSKENIVHLHRLRALFDAVVVGRKTAAIDNPQLTTRLVSGPNPARIVIDLGLRSNPGLNLFSDERAPTFLICAADAPRDAFPRPTTVLRVGVARAAVRWAHIIERLASIGLGRLFIEGGGNTVSRCVAEGVVDRLHLTIAPVIVGLGCAGLRLDAPTRFADALRPPTAQFQLGTDVLFDLDLRGLSAPQLEPTGPS